MPRPPSFDRKTVLEKVLSTFWARGFEATSLDALERATGLKRQSLYNAFGDKEAMFLVSLDLYRERVGAPLHALLIHDDPAKAIRAYLDSHVRLLSDPCTPPGCMIANCSSELGTRDDRLGARMRNETQEGIDALRIVFRNWKKSGKLAESANPETLAALVATIVRGLGVLARSSEDNIVLKSSVDGAVQALEPLLVSS